MDGRGDKGDKGDRGDRGDRGFRSLLKGERGPRGEQGAQGERGETGAPGEGWEGYRRMVTHELTRLANAVEKMAEQEREDHAALVQEIADVKGDIGTLKVKAGAYGALSGLGAGLAVFFATVFGR